MAGWRSLAFSGKNFLKRGSKCFHQIFFRDRLSIAEEILPYGNYDLVLTARRGAAEDSLIIVDNVTLTENPRQLNSSFVRATKTYAIWTG